MELVLNTYGVSLNRDNEACYDNEDSMLIVPLSTDHIKAMRVNGKTIDTEIVMHNKNTMFF